MSAHIAGFGRVMESCILFPLLDVRMFCFWCFVMIRSWLICFSVAAALKLRGGDFDDSQRGPRCEENDKKINIPEEILLDGRNSVHLTDLTSDTLDLDANMSAPLNDLIGIICELWRRSIAIKLDITRNHLCFTQSALPPSSPSKEATQKNSQPC
jgi:hypothetical protein